MTIPEAVSLVLQAGAYAKNGQIFVLDMGEPVRIYDLAYNLIKLSGLEPDVDIKIECTGLRPGEKLFEERLMAEEGLQKTANGLISIAKPLDIDEENLFATLDELYKAAYEETDQMKEWVKRLVPTYTIDKRAQKTPLETEAATAVV
jgi:FlaA1/EpsC-like NDP-sugar epimerase